MFLSAVGAELVYHPSSLSNQVKMSTFCHFLPHTLLTAGTVSRQRGQSDSSHSRFLSVLHGNSSVPLKATLPPIPPSLSHPLVLFAIVTHISGLLLTADSCVVSLMPTTSSRISHSTLRSSRLSTLIVSAMYCGTFNKGSQGLKEIDFA